jgi:DNA repair protein RecO (recombination protein O)
LILTVLEHIRSGAPGAVWRGTTYFTLWAVRIAGLLTEMDACVGCGAWLADPEADPENPERAFFRRGASGLVCMDCKRTYQMRDSWELTLNSRATAAEMLRKPVSQIAGEWSRETAADLRRFLQQQIESHIERRLITVPVLEAA